MIGATGSTLWLLRNEMRLGWRDMLGKRGAMRGYIIVGVLLLAAGTAGVGLGFALRHVQIPVNPLSVILSLAVMTAVFTLMLSQTLAAATQALYARGDLDLLFSSPIGPAKVLTVRFAAIALNVFTGFAMLIGPVLIPVAVVGHWRWLGAILVLAALALAASASGLLLAMALFKVLGPRRTRTVAQIMAAVIGSMFFLAAQARNILGGARAGGLWLDVVKFAMEPRHVPPPAAAWPLRAMLGEPLPLAILLIAAVGLFMLANLWLGRRFASDAAAASGAETASVSGSGSPASFATGAFAATVAKELRLLRRDAALLSQVLLRVLYMIPVSFVLLQRAGTQQNWLLPGGAAALALMAGQVAGSLTWITVSAEDAPDLLACAPTPLRTLSRAKLTAALTPVALLLAIPLLALMVINPQVGLAAAAGSAAATLASGWINVWYQKPGKRADFRRRRGSSWFVSLMQALVTMLIAAATGAAAAPWPWTPFALIPAVLAAFVLLLLRRTDAQIAEALRAAA